MAQTPTLINNSDMPLRFIGYEKETNNSVYSLTGKLNVDMHLSLKYSGYVNKETILSTGEVIERAWVK